MRLDRLATLYLFHPLNKRSGAAHQGVPVLMYHSISNADERGLHPYYRTVTAPETFRDQMEWLHRAGYSTLPLGDALGRLGSHEGTAKTLVITFDDGYSDFYEHAFPVLQEFGFTATVYLPTAYIGDVSRKFKEKDCLTWSQVRELQREGISFGSHTITHRTLDSLPETELEIELEGSKAEIEEKTGVKVRSFAYPYAFPRDKLEFKRRLRGLLCKLGYEDGVCTTIGIADSSSDALFVPRLPMNSCDDTALIEAKLCGSYDWLAGVQLAYKRLKTTANMWEKQ